VEFFDTYLYQPGPTVTDLNEVALSIPWNPVILPGEGTTPSCSWDIEQYERGTILSF
jgi:pSer/pThr/pTyr-binding forkhead associated (FHA) protein